MCASLTAFAQASVTTDKSDYPPGSTVIISGSGFQPGEIVQLQVLNVTNASDTGPEHDAWTTNADENGNFTTTWYVTEDELNQTLRLTAQGLTSGLTAEATFTDASYKISSISIGAQTGTPAYGVAGNATYTITNFFSGNGQAVDSVTNLVIAGLPAGATASFKLVPTTGPGTGGSSGTAGAFTNQLTVTTAATTPAGTFTITVVGDDNKGNHATNTVALAIDKTALSITANNAIKIYGQTITYGSGSMAFTSNGLKNGESIGSVTITASGGTTANAPLGVYALTPGAATGGTFNANNYTITYNNGTLTVVPGPASALVVSGYPSPREAGLPGTLTVKAVDQFGNTATNYTGTVHLTTGDGLASLAANHTFTATDAGIFQFFGNAFGTAGTQSITATDINSNSVTGTQLGIVIISTTANKLAFTTQPAVATNGAIMTAIVVQVQDQFGNNVASSGVSVSLALVGAGTLTGTTNVTTTAGGAATFTDLALTGAGVGKVFIASATGLIGATSTAFDVARAGTADNVSISANPSPTGSNVTLTATLSALAPGSGMPTGSVQFFVDGSAFGSPATLTGGSANISSASLAHGSHTVSAQYAGDGNFFGSTNNLPANLVINTTPAAGVFALTTKKNIATTASAGKLAATGKDADLDALSVTAVTSTSAQGGTVSLGGGTITYTPPTNYTGADSFTYTLADSFGAAVTGTVSVTVNAAGSGQTANITSFALQPDGSAKMKFAGIPGRNYLIQATTNIALPNWVTIATNTAGTNGLFIFIDNDAPNYPSRYYRTAQP